MKFKTDTSDSESRAGVRSRSSESGDNEEYWTDCFDYVYVNVQYDMWLKCMLRENVFPPTLGEQCG